MLQDLAQTQTCEAVGSCPPSPARRHVTHCPHLQTLGHAGNSISVSCSRMASPSSALAYDGRCFTQGVPIRYIPPAAKVDACQSILSFSTSLCYRYLAPPHAGSTCSPCKSVFQASPPHRTSDLESFCCFASNSRSSSSTLRYSHFRRCVDRSASELGCSG